MAFREDRPMTFDVSSIVDDVIAASPPVPDAIDALSLAQHKELERLVRRDGITPEAAHAVIRGRRQSQHAELERKRVLEASVAGLFK
jgi:hypothetical protein